MAWPRHWRTGTGKLPIGNSRRSASGDSTLERASSVAERRATDDLSPQDPQRVRWVRQAVCDCDRSGPNSGRGERRHARGRSSGQRLPQLGHFSLSARGRLVFQDRLKHQTPLALVAVKRGTDGVDRYGATNGSAGQLRQSAHRRPDILHAPGAVAAGTRRTRCISAPARVPAAHRRRHGARLLA